MMLPDQVAAKNNVGVRHKDHGVSSSVAEHVTDLNQSRSQIDIHRIGINHIGQHQGLDSGFVLRFGSSSKEFQVFSAQPAAQIAMRQNGGPGFSKNSVPARMVEVVMSVDHVTDGQVCDFANLRQQFFGGLDPQKGV